MMKMMTTVDHRRRSRPRERKLLHRFCWLLVGAAMTMMALTVRRPLMDAVSTQQLRDSCGALVGPCCCCAVLADWKKGEASGSVAIFDLDGS
jgi:hypothetical protein